MDEELGDRVVRASPAILGLTVAGFGVFLGLYLAARLGQIFGSGEDLFGSLELTLKAAGMLCLPLGGLGAWVGLQVGREISRRSEPGQAPLRLSEFVPWLLVLFLGILPCWMLGHQLVSSWEGFRNLFPVKIYLENEILGAWLSLDWLALSFLLHRAGRRIASRLATITASGLCLVVVLDLGCLLTVSSCGPGGRLSISHDNWYNRYVHNNRQGFWERSLEPFAPPHRRPLLVLVGDSFTWGQGLPGRQYRYGDILSQALGPTVDVLNLSIAGTNTRDQIALALPELARLRPDVVIVGYLANDIHDGLNRMPNPPPMPLWQHRLLVAFPLSNFLYWRVHLGQSGWASDVYRALIANYQDPKTFAEHQTDLRTLVTRIRALGSRPVMAILPFPHLWSEFPPEVRTQIYARLTATVTNLNVPVIPLYELESQFPLGHFEVGPMDAHPSTAVHQAMAARILSWLKEHPEILPVQ